MLYGSKTNCLWEKELSILRRSERAMCGVKMMDFLVLNEPMDKMEKTNKVRWYRLVSRREDGDVLQKALEFKLDGQKKIGRSEITWRTQM